MLDIIEVFTQRNEIKTILSFSLTSKELNEYCNNRLEFLNLLNNSQAVTLGNLNRIIRAREIVKNYNLEECLNENTMEICDLLLEDNTYQILVQKGLGFIATIINHQCSALYRARLCHKYYSCTQVKHGRFENLSNKLWNQEVFRELFKIDNKYRDDVEKMIKKQFHMEEMEKLLKITEDCDKEILLQCFYRSNKHAYMALKYYKPREGNLISDIPDKIEKVITCNWHKDWLKDVYIKERVDPDEKLKKVLRIRIERIISKEADLFGIDLKIII